MATKVQNPIKEDPVLRKLLQDLHAITSKRDFTRWKASFVERFSTFLSSDGEVAANAKRDMYQKELALFVKVIQQLEDHISNGDLSLKEGKTTVKARKCLAEVQKHLTRVANETENLIPGTGEQAREMGYTKFHMGAVLINDGFEEYDRLSLCADIMQRMREGVLAKVADKQLLEEMENYVDKFDMFCDVMADLGLLQAMKKCRELLHLPDEPEPEPEPEPASEPEVEYESEGSIEAPLSPIKKSTEFNTSYKQDDGSGRLEMTTKLEGSGNFDGENSKSFSLGFPGIKPPSGPFIKFIPPEEYARRKKEREEAAKLKKETDEIAYKPVQKIDFGFGRNYHGTSNVTNLSIKPDLADDYSSGADSSHSSNTPKKETKKVTKKVVKKVVKKVIKKKPKEGGTTEKPQNSKESKPSENRKTDPKTPIQTTKPKAGPPSPPVKVIQECVNYVDDDDLTMNTLSPDHKTKPKIPPSALVEENSDESSCSESSEDITLAHLVDFDGMEGVKGLKKSNH